MFKINNTQYVCEGILYHRVFRSSLYELDDTGEAPAMNLFEIYRDLPGKTAVIFSSHAFWQEAILGYETYPKGFKVVKV